jgi:uncharacterized protein YggU (UPF0235/DUF167 family)
VRLTIRVRPGSSTTAVGGRYDGGTTLVVRVTPPAVDGRATEAALRAVAQAFSVAPRSVRLVSGVRGRTKILDVSGDDHELARRLAELLGEPETAQPA